MSDISVILVSYNTINMTRKALSHLFASSHNLEMNVYIIDNASKDNSAETLRSEYPDITLIENNQNVGFGRANNQALPYINSRYVLLLNTDAFVEQDTISKTVAYMDANPKCGILGVKLFGSDGKLQPSCRFFPTPWNTFFNRTGLNRIFTGVKMVDDMTWDHASVRECDWVPGCYFLIRKEVIDQVGLFDPRYFLYFEELDLCFAAKRADWHVTYFPYTSVVHIGGESAKSEGKLTSTGRQINALQIESELLYYRKNYGLITAIVSALLNTLSDSIQIMKNIIRLKHPRNFSTHLAHSYLVWKLFFRTHICMKATR